MQKFPTITQKLRIDYAVITQRVRRHYGFITQILRNYYAIALGSITQFITQLNYAIKLRN